MTTVAEVRQLPSAGRWLAGVLLSSVLLPGALLADHKAAVVVAAQSTAPAVTAPLDISIDKPIDQAGALISRLENIQSLQARFEQITLDARQQRVQQTQGSLQVATPGRFRLETQQPDDQVLVSDGRSFWAYDAELEQVVISELAQDISQVPVLLLSGNITDIRAQYLVVGFSSETDNADSEAGVRDVFVLSPRANTSLFESLTLEFAGAEPREIVLRDSLGQQSRILLTEVRLNPELSDAVFTFEAPEGVDIVDNRPPVTADEPVR